MNYSRERQALSVSGANSDYNNQRSYNYTNTSYYQSDLGLSTLSTSATGTVKPLKNTKNYLKDIESKFNQQPDPRADLQLLSRHKNNRDVLYTGSYKIEKEMKDDQVPQIFRKMQPNSGEEIVPQRNSIFQTSPIKKSIQMSQVPGPQQQPFKILNYNNDQQYSFSEQPKKGFFEKIFSFSGNDDNNNNINNSNNNKQRSQIIFSEQNKNLQNMNDIESSLVKLKSDMTNNLNNNNQQFNFTYQMRQQLGISIDLVNRVLREQATPILQQLIKAVGRARHAAKQQLYTSEQMLMDSFYEQIEFLAQQKILKLKVYHFPTEEQDIEDRQQFYQTTSQYILNTKGYYPTKQQLDLFYDEINHLRVQRSEWIDFISRRI